MFPAIIVFVNKYVILYSIGIHRTLNVLLTWASLTLWVWEYTGFGPTIGLLNLQAVDCSNSVLYDESHKLTRKPKTTSL